MKIIRITLGLAGPLLLASGCEMLQPRLNVDVKAVIPCNQASAMDGVGLMQVKSVGEGGETQSVNAKRSSGTADLSGLTITDGTTVFMNGYAGEGADALQGFPVVSGASVPMDLASYSEGQRLPPANREFGQVGVLLGRVNSFGRTTDMESGACTGLSQARHGHTATFSSAVGKVIILGGLNYAQSDGAEAFVPRARALEVYDPSTGQFSTPQLSASVAPLMERAFHSATELPDGNILVIGGVGPDGDGTQVSPRAVSFILNPADFSTTQLGPNQGFQIKRFHHTATLAGNNVILVGGCGCKGSLTNDQVKAGECPAVTEQCTDGLPRVAAVERFDVTDRRITPVTSAVLQKPRAFHTASLVLIPGDPPRQHLVIAGGDDGVSPVREVEILRAAPAVELISPSSDTLDTSAVTHAAAVVLPSADCRVVVPGRAVDTTAPCVLITGGCLSVVRNGTCSMTQTTGTVLDLSLAPGSRRLSGPALFRPRWGHHAFHLDDGANMVVLAGGSFRVDGNESPVSAELLRRASAGGMGVPPFAPATPPFMFASSRRGAAAVFPGGQILLTGGVESVPAGASVQSVAAAEFFFHPLR